MMAAEMSEQETVNDPKAAEGGEDDHSVDEAVVQEASGQGWVPKEKFKGHESDWVDAQTFVKRGREILPILRKNNETLLKELKQTKASLEEVRATTDEFKKFQKDAYDRKAKELEQEIIQLKTAKAQAISEGDGNRVNVLDEALDSAKEEATRAKIEQDRAALPPPRQAGHDPKLQEWLDKNEWFGKDTRMTSMANSLGQELRKENPALVGTAFLNKLDETLREEFPHKFGKTESGERTPAYGLESGSGRDRPAGGSRKSYSNLPSEAKAACDRFVKQKLMTREQYVQEFEWE